MEIVPYENVQICICLIFEGMIITVKIIYVHYKLKNGEEFKEAKIHPHLTTSSHEPQGFMATI